MAYFFLALFWSGILMLPRERKYGLKQRSEAFSQKEVRKVRGKLSDAFASVRAKLRREDLTSELCEGLAYVKNTAVLGRSAEMSAQELLSLLADFSGSLSGVYEEMARHLSVGDKDLAREVFVSSTCLSVSAGVAELLSGWDDVDPGEICETLDSYLAALREERITERKRKNGIVSDLLYLPVVVNCVLVLINFLFVSFFAGYGGMLTVIG